MNIDCLVLQKFILARRSMRLMSGRPVSEETLMQLFEAARWAPSEYNNQPWRFLYFLPTDEFWGKILDALNEGNRAWADKAGAIVVTLSRTMLEYKNKPSKSFYFDTGAACQNLSLMAVQLGLAVCTIGGFDREQIRKLLLVPDNFELPVMLAIGYPRDGVVLPSGVRKLVGEIACRGRFPAAWCVK